MEEAPIVKNPQEVNQPIKTPVENQVRVEEKTKKNFSLALILSFTTIIATLIAAFFYFQNTQLRNVLQKNLPSPTPTATLSETAGWKTYTDSNNEYSFKYPSNWNTLNINNNSLMVAPQADIDQVSKMVKAGGGFGGGDFLIMLINKNEKKPSITTDEYQTVIESSVNISSIEALKYEITFLQNGPGFEKGKKHFSVVIPTSEKYLSIDLVEQKYLDTYNLILSTFKFIEGSKINCVSPRPEVCTEECIVNPPFICGSDGKSYCTTCQACANKNVEWYEMKDTSCGK
jgi:hypothetical protein